MSRRDSQQSAAKLKIYLAQAGLQAGERLPGERDLAMSLGMGRSALRLALETLETEGALERRAKAAEKKYGVFRTIVHTNHGMSEEVRRDFRGQGLDWCEAKVPGAAGLIEKHHITFPESVEQHDLSEAKNLLGWEAQVGFAEFLKDLKARDERGENIRALWTPSDLSVVF